MDTAANWATIATPALGLTVLIVSAVWWKIRREKEKKRVEKALGKVNEPLEKIIELLNKPMAKSGDFTETYLMLIALELLIDIHLTHRRASAIPDWLKEWSDRAKELSLRSPIYKRQD